MFGTVTGTSAARNEQPGEAPAGQAAASADKISRSRIRTSVST
jgi:hypothetical protein